MSSDDPLKRVESLLEHVIRRLERLEELLTSMSDDPTHSVALELVLTFSMPVQKAVKMARDLVSMLRGVPEVDPIMRAVVEVLISSGDGVSISELTRRVRRVRGTASRRVIAERLRVLEARGIVMLRKSGNVTRVYLKKGGLEERNEQGC
ncbi:MAG: ArsR family transcriptional regulator [Zestosphaera sp.]